jgi:HSP20 family protein
VLLRAPGFTRHNPKSISDPESASKAGPVPAFRDAPLEFPADVRNWVGMGSPPTAHRGPRRPPSPVANAPQEVRMFVVPVSRTARGFDRFFDDALDRLFTDSAPRANASGTAAAARAPALDVVESDTAYTVLIDMPGLTREDIKVKIEDRRVTVTGQAAEATAPREGDRVVWRERQALSYARTFTLAADIDQGDSQARYENGVLTLTLAKRRANASQLTIN